MIDAYTIGIRLALDDDVSAGVRRIQAELEELNRATAASAAGLTELTRLGQGLATPEGSPASVRHLEQRPPLPKVRGAPDPTAPSPVAPIRGANDLSTPPGKLPNPSAHPTAIPTPRAFAAEPVAASDASPSATARSNQTPLARFSIGILQKPASVSAPGVTPSGGVTPKAPGDGGPGSKPGKPLEAVAPASTLSNMMPVQPRAAVVLSAADPSAPKAIESAAPLRSLPTRSSAPESGRGVPMPQLSNPTASPTSARVESDQLPVPAASRQLAGELLIDGNALGRWMTDSLAAAASRPPSATTGFSPRSVPRWRGLGGN